MQNIIEKEDRMTEEISKGQPFLREVSCCTIPGHGVLSITSNNTPGGVNFDFFTIWSKLKEIKHNQVCMIHTHPPGHTHMSSIDYNMVFGWCQALGVPILYVIVTEKTIVAYFCTRSKDNKKVVDRKIVNVKYSNGFCSLIDFLRELSIDTNDFNHDLKLDNSLLVDFVNDRKDFFDTRYY